MKGYFFTFTFLMILFFSTDLISQTIYVSGEIDSNTLWDADTVKVIGDLTVNNGVKLSVGPGTYIEFQGYYALNVAGCIRAIGTMEDSIVFTALNTNGFWIDTLSAKGGWAGIKLQNATTSPDSSIFDFCKIQYGKKYDLYAEDNKGGAINAENYGTLIITNSELSSNMVIGYSRGVVGPAGGAVYCKYVGHVIIENNRFLRNRSFESGGAIHINRGCQALINRNTFIGNKAIWWESNGGWNFQGGYGAAIATSDAFTFSPTISNNYCFNNQSVTSVIYTSNLNGLIFNNIICNNFSVGVFDGHQLSYSRIFNNTIINNTSSNGGIMLISGAFAYNNICWGNENQSGQMHDQIDVSQASYGHMLFNNCVEYGDGGTNSITAYPEFEDPSDGVGLLYEGADADWSLRDESPCINHGAMDTTGLFIPEYDIEGNSRIYGTAVEMGAIENQNVIIGIFNPESQADNFLIFPNPGTSILNIQQFLPESSFRLYNSAGEVILHEYLNGNSKTLYVESLAPGLYFYKLSNPDRTIIKTGKWIKI